MARFLAMVMMIQGHTIYALASPETVDISVFPWNVWDFLRGVTAPVFLFVSGAANVFANKRDDSGKLKRKTILRRLKIALLLVFIGYLLAFPCQRIFDLFYIEQELLDSFCRVNILHLIGVSLLMLLSVFLLTRTDRSMRYVSLSIALIITFMTPFTYSVDWFGIFPEPIAAYLSKSHGSIFPIFPYTAYLFYGAAFGVFLKSIDPRKRVDFLLKYSILIGVAIISVGYLINYFLHFDLEAYKILSSNFRLIFINLGYVFVALSVLSLIYLKTKGLTKYYTIFGKRALFIYVGHLMIIYGSAWFPSINEVYAKSLSLLPVLMIVLVIVLITLAAAYFYEYTMNNFKRSKMVYRILAAAYVFFVLFI